VRAVRTTTVAPESAGGSQEFAAEVRARTESRLGFRVGGKMVSRSVDLGQRVKAGDVLAQLDPADLRLGEAAAAAAVRAAQVNVDLAEADYRRYKELRDQGFISGAELDRRDSTLKAARAQLAQASAQASVQGNQAGYSLLTAPAGGVITAVEAEPGTVLATGATVVRLAHDGPRDVVFSVPEDAVAGMRPLQGKAGALRVRIWGSNETVPATVREIAAAADPATRTFLVKADLGRADVQLGQTAAVLLELPRRDVVAKLPLTALTQDRGRTSVWLVDPASMTVRLQAVAVAGAEGNTVLVASGLSPGQLVVTAGVHVLTPGQKVKLFDTPVAAPPNAGVPSVAASR
jgi:RND family efflux transporter MFP subunit